MNISSVNSISNNPRSTIFQAATFASPALGIFLLMIPISSVLSGVYAKYFDLSLTSIATVLLIARVFDAITDPIIGYYSDKWFVRTGSRKPLVICGGLLLLPSAYFLLVPPVGAGAFHFAFWYIAFHLAFTLFYIPYLAWANDFTQGSNEKAMLFSFLAIVSQAGGAIFYVVPLLPFFVSSEISPEVLKATALIAFAFLIPGLLVAYWYVPSGKRNTTQKSVAVDNFPRVSVMQRIYDTICIFLSNKPFVIYVVAYMCLGMALGMWYALFFIYVDVYLKLGDLFAEISLWGSVCSLFATPLWYRSILRFGKRASWLFGIVVLMLVFLCATLLSPGRTGFEELLLLNVLLMIAIGSINVVSTPMLCDIVDYGRLQDSTERGALYFAIQALMIKMQSALGGGLGIAIIGWFNFDMHAKEQTSFSLTGLYLGISWLPLLFSIMALMCIILMPLNEDRMMIVRRSLERRSRR